VQRTANALLLIALGTLVGCVALAPGADQVRLTHEPADVRVCKALGNLAYRRTTRGSSMGPLCTQSAGTGWRTGSIQLALGTRIRSSGAWNAYGDVVEP